MAAENPRKWRFTWEAQSHVPILRLFIFDSYTKPSVQCQNLQVRLNPSQSLVLVSWFEEFEVSLRVPTPRVLVEPQSPVSFRALDDHIEVKLILLLPVDHPIISSFDSVLNLSEDREKVTSDAVKPLEMDSDLESLCSSGEVHFYCRSCSFKLTKSPLRNFVEMPSVNWREVADNWFGNCCCSFGGVSEKLVTGYAKSYTCAEGICQLSSTTVTLCKDDLVEWKSLDHVGGPCSDSGPDVKGDNRFGEAALDCRSKDGGIITSDDLVKETRAFDGKIMSMHPKDEDVPGKLRCGVNEEEAIDDVSSCLLPESNFSRNMLLVPVCCDHPKGVIPNHVDEDNSHHVSESKEIKENQKCLLNGFLGNVFMVRSFNQSVDVEWIEYVCPQCSTLLGAYPYGNGYAPVDFGVRLFKCYISTSSAVGGSGDLFREYTLERMFTNQLLESAKDESSYRTLVKDVKTRSPLLQIVLLNPSSWSCTGYCVDAEGNMGPVSNMYLRPVIKVLFSDCSNSSKSESRTLEEWETNNSADEVFMMARQIKELIKSLESRKDVLPTSYSCLQGLSLSSICR